MQTAVFRDQWLNKKRCRRLPTSQWEQLEWPPAIHGRVTRCVSLDFAQAWTSQVRYHDINAKQSDDFKGRLKEICLVYMVVNIKLN